MIQLATSPVRFIEEEHRYLLGEKELRGITSTLVKRAFPDTYKGVDEATLARAAKRGADIHKAIEAYETDFVLNDCTELKNYVAIKEHNHLTHIAAEYIVSDTENYASAIDHVFVDGHGEIVIADIKTTSVKHYENVALQLSIYKHLFELQNPQLKVSRGALIWLRGSESEYRELSFWADEMLDELIYADLHDEAFDVAKTYGNLPQMFANVEEEIANIEMGIKVAQERQKELKKGLYDLMEKHNVKSFSGSRVKLTRVLPTSSVTFDTKAFKEQYPDLYEDFSKETQKAGSLRITVIE